MITKGARVVIIDAAGNEHRATALSGVEPTHEGRRKIHDFPVVWVSGAGYDRDPWPAESVRLESTA